MVLFSKSDVLNVPISHNCVQELTNIFYIKKISNYLSQNITYKARRHSHFIGYKSPYMTSLNSEHDCSAEHCTMVCWAVERLGRVSDYTHLAKLVLLLWGLISLNILMVIHFVLRKQETFAIHPLSTNIHLQFVQYSF